MASRKDPYETKTFRTGMSGSSRKIDKLIAAGWEVASTTRYGFAGNQVTMRRPNPKYRGEQVAR